MLKLRPSNKWYFQTLTILCIHKLSFTYVFTLIDTIILIHSYTFSLTHTHTQTFLLIPTHTHTQTILISHWHNPSHTYPHKNTLTHIIISTILSCMFAHIFTHPHVLQIHIHTHAHLYLLTCRADREEWKGSSDKYKKRTR